MENNNGTKKSEDLQKPDENLPFYKKGGFIFLMFWVIVITALLIVKYFIL